MSQNFNAPPHPLPPLHLCTVASHASGNLEKLKNSCIRHRLNLKVLGLGAPFRGMGEKFCQMQKHLETLQDDEVVLFVDAYDTLILAPENILLEKFLNFKAPIVLSAERNCWPYRELATRFPKSPTSFQYVNTGTYVGYVKALKELFNKLRAAPSDDDQGLMMLQYLKQPENYALDTSCELFLPLLNMTDELEIDTVQGSLFCKETKSTPCVIHGNGSSLWYDYLYTCFYNAQEQSARKTTLISITLGRNAALTHRLLQWISNFNCEKKWIAVSFNDLECTPIIKQLAKKWALDHRSHYQEIILDSEYLLHSNVASYKQIHEQILNDKRLHFRFNLRFDALNADYHVNELGAILKERLKQLKE